MRAALAEVEPQLGREYPLLVGGEHVETGNLLASVNPANPVRSSAPCIRERARSRVERSKPGGRPSRRGRTCRHSSAHDTCSPPPPSCDVASSSSRPGWSTRSARAGPRPTATRPRRSTSSSTTRREMLRLRADRSRSIAVRRASENELVYVPLGVGVVIPPWNFPLAIMAGMTTAALVAGNTRRPQAVARLAGRSRAKFVEVLEEAGFPPASSTSCPGSGDAVGDTLVDAPADALHRLHRLARGRPAHQRARREAAAGPDLDQARRRRDGRQGRHRRRRDADLDAAADGIVASAFGFRGRSARPARARSSSTAIYDAGARKRRRAHEDAARSAQSRRRRHLHRAR